MECVDAKLRMEPYATGNLSSPDREAFEEHVAHCEGCRLELELTKAMNGSGEIEESTGDSAPEVPAAQELVVGTPEAGGAPAEGAPAEGSSMAFATDSEISFADIAPEITGTSLPEASLDALLASVQPPGSMPAATQERTPAPASSGADLPGLESSSASPPSGAPVAPLSAPARDRATVEDPLANLVASAPAASAAPSRAPSDAAPSGGAASPGSPRGDAPSWDFEPADAKPQAPPPGSLFMAEEALQRGRSSDADRKRAKCKFLVMEINYGHFECVIEIPDGYDLTQAKAAYQNGFLQITVPQVKRPAPKNYLVPVTEE